MVLVQKVNKGPNIKQTTSIQPYIYKYISAALFCGVGTYVYIIIELYETGLFNLGYIKEEIKE